MTIKSDFPILNNNKDLVFFDSTASSQKPSYVIDGIKTFLENDYSNIHRGAYILAENSEKLYVDSKKKVAKFLGANLWKEVIYSFNSTYAANLLTTSIRRTKLLKAGDKVLISIVEHHANVVPWLILTEEIDIKIEYVKVKKDFSLDFEDLEKKIKDPKVKIVSLTHVSNVTGEVFDLERAGKIIKKEEKIFIIDASQSFPHFKVDVKKLQCDAMFFTGHKVMADSGIGVLWGKKDFLENLKPGLSGGGAISWVKKDSFREAPIPDKFEPGTPNMTGAVSLLRALEYIENIGGYDKIEKIEDELTKYFLKGFKNRDNIKLIGGTNPKTRVGVFSFNIEGIHAIDIADYLADNNICVRAGQHCAEPLMIEIGVSASCRASLYIYNTKEDIDKFFNVLDEATKFLS